MRKYLFSQVMFQKISNCFYFKFLGPLDENLYAEDFYLLEKITFTNLVKEITGIVENMAVNSKQ